MAIVPCQGGSRRIEHLGSAHNDAEVEALKVAAARRLAGGQGELDLGIEVPGEVAAASAPLPILASRMGHLWDALSGAYDVLGFDEAAGGDEVFGQLVLARIIEPTSNLDSLRVLEEVGVQPASYRTMNRRLPVYAHESWRRGLAAACAQRAALGPASLVLYDGHCCIEPSRDTGAARSSPELRQRATDRAPRAALVAKTGDVGPDARVAREDLPSRDHLNAQCNSATSA